MKTVGDYHRHKTAGGKAPKLTVIPGTFATTVSEFQAGPATLTPSLVPIAPYMEKNDVFPRKEVQAFPSETVYVPHTEYTNFLYVYPRLVTFANKKVPSGNKARNIAVRVDLLETDEFPLKKQPTGGKCIYSKSAGASFSTHAFTSITHHSKSPSFSAEIKVELPVEITNRHHLFFSFYHVSVAPSKKPKMMQKTEAPIGYAFLPLLQENKKVIDSDFELPVAIAGQTYSGGAILPGGYTQQRDLGMGQRAGPSIRYIDNGKPLFTVSAHPRSTVICSDDHLRNFFRECANHDRTPRSNKDLCQRIKALHALHNDSLFANLPVLFNQLLHLLPGSQSSNDEVATNVTGYLVHAVHTIHDEMSDETHNSLLRTYVNLVFKAPPATTDRTVHGELAKYLGNLMCRIDIDIHIVLKFLNHTWFFFQLIAKSMIQHVKLVSKPGTRQGRFTEVVTCHMSLY